MKEAKHDPLENIYKEREETLMKLNKHYQTQPPYQSDDIRIIKQQQDKYELKKLLNSNLEKITLPPDRPQYGPGAIVPNSVLVSVKFSSDFSFNNTLKSLFRSDVCQAKLLWPNRQPKKIEHEDWKPPTLSTKQLEALDNNQPIVSALELSRSISSSIRRTDC